mmetsp:Transcript_15570/g.33970  ORF Transcript_15570/g.33970 Transcript_15570/m.33970 type:complete len:444 (-) Transcript_15570:209-1540(-)|eukprot:CAMPEP_0168738608 /NCGR_PEP_ID=MMETSP0724-20121128/11023_1 /TAXON_ID=265536 /ORGANISM="Amphiprora sp., Strain CCMP467" /LENGTH=443 /DNA_ID=CAMNT_0008785961 /DNA_START=1 /DNA_END=1332 /DNA_ORIENTATION=+
MKRYDMLSVLVGIVPLPSEPSLDKAVEIVVASSAAAATAAAAAQEETTHDENSLHENDVSVNDEPILSCRQWSTAVDEGVPTLLLNLIIGEATTLTAEQVVELVEQQLVEQASQLWSLDEKDDDSTPITPRCEQWASAPAPLPLRPTDGYPVIRTLTATDDDNNHEPPEHRHSQSSWSTWAAPTMKEWGLVVQEQLLSPDQVAELSLYVTAAIDTMEQALAEHRPTIRVGRDDFCFAEMASRSAQRFDLLLNDQTSPEAVAFVREHIVSRNRAVQQFLQEVLHVGPTEYNYDISVVYSRPGAIHQGWHADGDHQPKTSLDAGWQADGWQHRLTSAYAVCLFVPLISLDEQVGYTQFWPASHRHRDLMGFGKVAELAQATWNGSCNAGDGVWYDYRLFHRGMPNQSKTTVRPVLQVLFKKKWYTEKANYGTEPIIPSTLSESMS